MKATLALLAALSLAACSQPAPQTGTDPAADRESSAVAPLKAQFKPIITGIDVKGTTLNIFVDAELYSEMDNDPELKLKAQALKSWSAAWKSNHPGKHATLRVRFRNYFGEDVFSESTKV